MSTATELAKGARRAAHRARRAHQRGVTLTEVMIVIVILGLISAGVSIAVFPKLQEAKINNSKINAREIRNAAETWRGMGGGDKCPTVQLLVQEKQLSSGAKVTDSWDQPYKIYCEDDETIVVSMGPDKKEGTADDIRIPENAAQK